MKVVRKVATALVITLGLGVYSCINPADEALDEMENTPVLFETEDGDNPTKSGSGN